MFTGDEHEPFTMPGAGPMGMLLLHGFMGSPAELRPLGAALAAAGISAHAPLLPGFGAEIGRLSSVRHRDWVAAADGAWAKVRAEHEVALLLGYSMGAAVALQVAAEHAPDRLVLMAPFWRIEDPRALLLWPLHPFVHAIKLFGDADFTDPATRETFHDMDPTLDLDDPATRRRLREETTLPTPALLELQRNGHAAGKAAGKVTAPALIVQGAGDKTATVESTRRLIAKLGGMPALRLVDGDHTIVKENRPAWPGIRDAIVSFALDGAVD